MIICILGLFCFSFTYSPHSYFIFSIFHLYFQKMLVPRDSISHLCFQKMLVPNPTLLRFSYTPASSLFDPNSLQPGDLSISINSKHKFSSNPFQAEVFYISNSQPTHFAILIFFQNIQQVEDAKADYPNNAVAWHVIVQGVPGARQRT